MLELETEHIMGLQVARLEPFGGISPGLACRDVTVPSSFGLCQQICRR